MSSISGRMKLHASLKAPPLQVVPIAPVPSMRRNDSCWCRSGLKYKKCHLNRELQEPINIFELEAKLVAQARAGYCSHPDPSNDPCSSIIIRSHTVQKKGGIAAIAEAGHVLTVKPVMKDMMATSGNPKPRKVGVNSASVFPGFCNKHDTTLFKPIEGSVLTLDKNSAFLFSYRAIAYERFSKEAQWKGLVAMREGRQGQVALPPRADPVVLGRDLHRRPGRQAGHGLLEEALRRASPFRQAR